MVYTEQQIVNMVSQNYITPQMVVDQMGGTAVLGDNWSMTLDNLKYAYNQSPTFYREVVADTYGFNGQTVTASEALLPKPVMDGSDVLGTTAEKFPATTTPAGNVKSGALAGRLPIGTLVGGVAIGAGIGLKEVAQHRKFWEDVGDAVIKDIQRDPSAGVNPLCLTETANVLWRCLEDGSIQAYCDKRDIDAVIQQLYNFNALNSGRLEPTIDHAGVQEVSFGLVDIQVVASSAVALGQPISASAISAAFMGAISQAGSTPYNAISANSAQGRVSVSLYNMPDTITIIGDGSHESPFQVYRAQDYGVVCCVAFYDTVTGDVTHINYETPSSFCYTSPVASDTIGFASNVGAIVIPKNPVVIDNPSALQAPADPDDFWTTFATWLGNGFTVNPYNPATNAYEPVTYLPFTAPDINWQNDPITGEQTDVWTGLYQFVDPFTSPTTTPVNNPSPWIFESIGDFVIPKIDIPTSTPWDNNPKFPNPTPNPIGSSPLLVPPSSGVSSGSKLFTVYNPSQANIDSLGAYLWTNSIIEQINKFFSNNPLDAIISLHMIYCTPTTGTNKNIYLGYLDSGVSSPIVTSQYETIVCGDVDVPELYGNALDYDGVSIQAFLPFIGWRSLRTKDVMGKRVRVIYKIDVYTGTCLALISVISAGSDQLLYSFEGNCSVQIPLTASDRTRLISGLITAGVGAVTGNPIGVVGGIASIKQDVDRSGSFSGNAGAMGIKKPYLVVSRSLNAQASNYNSLYGYPLNKSGVLKNFRGFTRVQSVHVDIPRATDYEKRLISDLLHRGVII